jgi:hypothetical protein
MEMHHVMTKKIKTGTIPTFNSEKIGSLVYCPAGLGIFLGFRGGEDSIKVASVQRDGGRDVFWVLKGDLYNPDQSKIDDLAFFYRASMEFYDHSSVRDERCGAEIEDLIQNARDGAYDLACKTVQRIRDLDEPHNVEGISICLDFAERSGAAAQVVEGERTALAVARERRRVEMGFAPFDAHTYYAALRDLGVEPLLVRLDPDGGLSEYSRIGANNGVGDTRRLHVWAMNEDPEGLRRNEYARLVWEARPASDRRTDRQFVPLGA